MNKSRKAARLHNVISHDNNGNVTLPADLSLSVAPHTSDNSSRVATTAWIRAYVGTQFANIVETAPAALDTLTELAAALGNDPNFATTVATSIGTKVPQARTITINGVSFDLSADRSWSIAAGVTSFNTRTGAIVLLSADVTGALGFTPYNATNPSGYITGYTETDTLASVTGRGATTSSIVTFTSTTSAASVIVRNDGSGESWRGRVGHFNATADKSVWFASYNGFAVVGAHNNALTAWADLLVNCVDNSGSGGTVRLAASAFVGNNAILHAGNYNSYAVPLTGGTMSGPLTINGNDNQLVINGSTGALPAAGIFFRDVNVNKWELYHYNSAFRFFNYSSGSEELSIANSGGFVTARTSFRAPIFYDSNNTAFYVDPASTSVLNSLTTGPLTIGTAVNSVIWNDGNGTYMENTGNNAATRVIRLQAHDGSFNYTQLFISGSGGFVSVSNQMRAPIFYDSNDTGYYIDPNSVSNDALRMRGGALFGPNPTWGAYLAVGTNGRWSGSYASVAATDGNLHLDAKDGSNIYLAWYNGSDVMVGGGIQALIYYDRANTAYYVDPAGTARLSYVVANGGIRIDGNENLYLDNNYGQSIIGLYTSTRYQGVFAMGNAYKLPIDGSSPGNLYGITWSHPNAGGVAGNLNTHGALFLENGTFMAAISGSIRARDDMRAPIFYDSNNTGYYVDAASTTALYDLTLVGAKHTYLYINPGNGYEAMVRYNGGSGSGWYVGKRTTAQLVGSESFHFYSEAAGRTLAGIDTSGNMFSDGSMRSPVFYDLDNTGYYLNPNGLSYLYSLELSGGAYFRPRNWIQFDAGYGIYWPNHYGAHLYPNSSTYTQLRIDGSKGGYGGIWDSYSAVAGIMYDGNGNGGVYREANGRWYWYYLLSSDCMGIGTSTTSPSYSLYLNKGVYAQSRIDATIYYDSANTAYYLDPNGASYLASSLEIANGYVLTNGVGGSLNMNSAAGGFGGYFQCARHLVIETLQGGHHVYILAANGNGVVKFDGAQSWSAHSDRRIKTIHSLMENNLSKLESINPIYYSFNNFADDRNRIGLIAQEVQAHFPELVEIDPMTDNLTLDYTGLIPVLLGAIKELKNKVETLETQLS